MQNSDTKQILELKETQEYNLLPLLFSVEPTSEDISEKDSIKKYFKNRKVVY